jgi:hypothetical protein
LLSADRDDDATGRPLVYRPTPRLLQLLGSETLEEARVRLRVPTDHRSETGPGRETEPPLEYQVRSKGVGE